MFGVISPAIAAMPLMVILTVTAIKDAIEDYKRHKADKSLNSSKTFILDSTIWSNVNVVSCSSDTSYKKWFAKNLVQPLVSNLPNVPNMKNGSAKNEQKPYTKIVQELIRYPSLPESQGNKPLSNSPNADSDYFVGNSPDLETMETITRPLSYDGWKETAWINVKVGDFILLKQNESIPADIIVMSTSEPDGICYVETKNLDGETNLKPRNALSSTNHISSAKDCFNLNAIIDSEAPTTNLYSYSAAIIFPKTNESAIPINSVLPNHNHSNLCDTEPDGSIIEGDENSHNIAPITIQNLLLRGSILRNCAWVIGMVVFTGRDTKVMLNSGQTPSKRSRIEKKMNPQVKC